MDEARRTYQSLPHLGLAGGPKYLVDGAPRGCKACCFLTFCKGIFFKLAIDNMVLYGGDDHAMKVAGHDLRGLNAFVAHSLMFHIYFPLTVSRCGEG